VRGWPVGACASIRALGTSENPARGEACVLVLFASPQSACLHTSKAMPMHNQTRVTKVSVTEPKSDLATMQVQHKPLVSAGSSHSPPRRREADARHGWAEEYEVSVWDVPLRHALYQGASRWDKERGNSVCSSSCAGPGAGFR
jgi:hypothetical protein